MKAKYTCSRLPATLGKLTLRHAHLFEIQMTEYARSA
jgi:hypothetical protein